MNTKIDYNKTIYGEPTMTPTETLAKLNEEKCIVNGRLAVFPQWLTAADLFELQNAGLMKTKTHKNTYAHTTYTVA